MVQLEISKLNKKLKLDICADKTHRLAYLCFQCNASLDVKLAPMWK